MISGAMAFFHTFAIVDSNGIEREGREFGTENVPL